MIILGIETSTTTDSIALMNEERLMAEYTLNLSHQSGHVQRRKRGQNLHSVLKTIRAGAGVYPGGTSFPRETHTSKLMPAIDKVLKDTSLLLKDLDGISVSLGPGAFTGLRIGIATAKGLAQGLDIPIVGIPTLDALAFTLSSCQDLIICPLLDARKKEVYYALYRNGKKLTKYLVCPPHKLLKKLKSRIQDPGSRIIFLGSGVEIYGGLIKKELGEKAIFVPKARRVPSAASIAELGLKRLRNGTKSELLTLKPIYVRAPVEN